MNMPSSLQNGFTLVELIISMVVLSVLAVGSVQFVSFSASAYVDTIDRSAFTTRASIINEKLMRSLRNALPNGIRITANQLCIEYIPILAATQYTKAPIVGSGNPTDQVSLVPLNASLVQSGYLSVYPIVNSEFLFDNTRNPGRVSSQEASYFGDDGDASVYQFSGGGSFQFEQSSPQKRLFIVDTPQAYCQEGSRLFYYHNYGFVGDITNLSGALPTSLPNRWLISDNLLPNSMVFDLAPSSLRRNALVSFQYQLSSTSSQQNFGVSHEVQVRNVP